jgi:hypothetical protein
MRAKLVSESLGKAPIYNKKEIIDFMLANQEPETVDMLRHEYETIPADEFEDLAGSIGFGPIGKYWTALDLQKNTNESLNENHKQTKPIVTTVDELFTWYMGDKRWDEDWQTTNTMTIDDKHAQDDGNSGKASLAFLRNHKDAQIKVKSIDNGTFDYDIEFKLNGHLVSFQAQNAALDTDDSEDMYESLNEGSNKFRDEETYAKAEEISSIVYDTYNGDDVEYEINDEDIKNLENALKEYINERIIIEDIEDLGDADWIIENLSENEIDEIYQSLVEAGFMESYDDDDDDTGVLDDDGNVTEETDY